MKRAVVFLLALFVIASAGSSPDRMALGAPRDAKGRSAADLIPADAQWTIICQVFAGPNRVAEAKRAKDFWTEGTGLPLFHVVHEAQQSTLYYGYYRSIDPKERKDGDRARADQARIDALTAPNGDRPFHGCIFMPLITQDPPANPEWNLANSKGYWSLQIGVYHDSPLRKQAAVDAVKEARARGIEAYYYHGPTSSMVCIGSWPRSAVKEQETAVAAAADPNQPILVSSEPLTLGPGTMYQRSTGQKVKQMAPRIEPLDPTLIEAMNSYPEHLVNGELILTVTKDRDGRDLKIPQSSYLVLVPSKTPGPLDPNAPPVPPSVASQGEAQQQQQPLPSAFLPPEPPRPRTGAGKLKGLDSN